MTVYAISDLHLSFGKPKPMDIFGPQWSDHASRIAENWDAVVGPDDIVLLPGDHSWAMKLDDAMPDLQYIADRPGKKVLVRGNHDYWWGRQITNKLQRMVDPSIILIQGTSIVLDNIAIGGTRGWRMEDFGLEGPVEGDAKIYARELTYLERSLESMPGEASVRIAMLHYPPFTVDGRLNEFAELLAKYRVDILVYGHIHMGTGAIIEGPVDGAMYHLVSVDHIGFGPKVVVDSPSPLAGEGRGEGCA